MSIISSLQQHEKIYNMTLLQLLQIDNQKNILAMALAKSRNQHFTPQLAAALERYVIMDQEKWLEVVRRLISNNFHACFDFVLHIQTFYRPVIQELYKQGTNNTNNRSLIQKIWYKIHQSMRTINNNPQRRLTTVKNFQFFLQMAVRQKDIQTQHEIFVFLSNQSKTITKILSYINYSQNQPDNNFNFRQLYDQWDIHWLAINLFLSIAKLVYNVEGYAVKQIRYDRFVSLLQNRIQQKYSIRTIIEKYLPSIISLLSTINISPTNCQSPIQISPRIYTIIYNSAKNKLTCYYSKLCQIIASISMITSLQLMFFHNTSIQRDIIRVIESVDIIMLNHYMNLDEELLAINGEITSNEYSDTLTGNFMTMIVKLCNNVGGFFNIYYCLLDHAVKSSKFINFDPKQPNTEYFINCLLKISLLSDSTILLHRQHTIQEILTFTTKIFSQKWSIYNQWQQVQILRYFMVFVGKGEGKGLGPTETAEELVSKCIDLCIASLEPCFSSKMDEEKNFKQIQFTPIQYQCFDLLKTLPERPNTLRLIKQSLLPNLLVIFINLPPTSTFIELFHYYLINVPQLITRSSQQIIEYFARAFVNQKIYYNNLKGNTQKIMQSNAKISKILKAIVTILTSESQLSFNDIEQKIVQPILSNLGTNGSQTYQDQLIQLLQVLLINHSHLTLSVCQIISKLPSIYQKNQKKLTIFRNIYKALSISNEIKRQVEYQYGDIIMIMLMMATDYIDNVLAYEEALFYAKQMVELIFMLNIFLNKYTAKISQDQQLLQLIGVRMFNGLTKCMRDTKNKMDNESIANCQISRMEFYQLIFQMQMVITHICISPTASKFNYKVISQVINEIKVAPITYFYYIQTIKMIPIIIIDQLIINATNHERIISDLITYCQFMGKLQIQGGMDKQWKNINGVQHWDQWPNDMKKYIQEILRELRTRKQIDNVDHVQYLEALDSVLF